MSSAIEKLYGSSVFQNVRRKKPCPLAAESAKYKQINLDKLMMRLDEQEKELFEKYRDSQEELEEFAQYQDFCLGLQFGVLLMAEVFGGADELVGYEEL